MSLALVEPSFEEAVEVFRRSLAEGMVFLLVGDCTVEYRGRGSASLDFGSRMVIVKPDGVILVHAGGGVEPLNWQPPGSKIEVYEDSRKSLLTLTSTRSLPYENVTVKFRSLTLAAAFKLEAKPRLKVEVGEEVLREAILAKPSLLEEGFQPISTEKPVASGFIDIYGRDREGRLVVVELKRVQADLEAVKQLKNYVESLKEEYGEVRGILAAPSITYKAYAKLREHQLEYKRIDPALCIKTLEARKGKQKKLGEYINEKTVL